MAYHAPPEELSESDDEFGAGFGYGFTDRIPKGDHDGTTLTVTLSSNNRNKSNQPQASETVGTSTGFRIGATTAPAPAAEVGSNHLIMCDENAVIELALSDMHSHMIWPAIWHLTLSLTLSQYQYDYEYDYEYIIMIIITQLMSWVLSVSLCDCDSQCESVRQSQSTELSITQWYLSINRDGAIQW